MKLNVLLSAMHLRDYTYINSLNIASDCVVVNQCDRESLQTIKDANRQICYIETTERGLSKMNITVRQRRTAGIRSFGTGIHLKRNIQPKNQKLSC